MLLGKSLFQSVVDRLVREEEAAAADDAGETVSDAGTSHPHRPIARFLPLTDPAAETLQAEQTRPNPSSSMDDVLPFGLARAYFTIWQERDEAGPAGTTGQGPADDPAGAGAGTGADGRGSPLIPDAVGESASDGAAGPETQARFARLQEWQIAEDLGLQPEDDAASLAAKRRTFALANHPDRWPAQFSSAAHHRMTVANRLVDGALRRQKPVARRAHGRPSGRP